eukprot:SAG31_NODE_1346_length_8698_cov_1.561693_2_plen_591_part_00
MRASQRTRFVVSDDCASRVTQPAVLRRGSDRRWLASDKPRSQTWKPSCGWRSSVLAAWAIATSASGAAQADFKGSGGVTGRLRLVRPLQRAMLEPSLTGLQCELESVSDLRYGASSVVQFSFSPLYSPRRVDHLLVCFNAPRMQLQLQNVSVELLQAHDVHTGVSRTMGTAPTVAITTIPDVLSNDRYFATSFHESRYDDFLDLDMEQGDLIGRNKQLGEQDNCLVLSDTWQFNQIFTVRLKYLNSVAPSANDQASEENIAIWIAPLGLEALPAGGEAPVVRGPKYGAMCGVAGSPGWNLTNALHSTPALDTEQPPGEWPRVDTRLRHSRCIVSNATSCAHCHYALGPTSLVGGSACTGSLCCSSCTATGVAITGPDAGLEWCPTTRNVKSAFATVLTSVQANATTLGLRTSAGQTSLAGSLCDHYGLLKMEMIAGQFSDQVVPTTLFLRFLEDASPLVDNALVFRVNETLWGQATDGRRPGWPTREHGLGRRCSSGWGGCSDNGFYENARFSARENDLPSTTWIGDVGSRKVPVYADRRYRSLYTFALMGALLQESEASFTCVKLGHSTSIGRESAEPWPLTMNDLGNR